MLEISKRGAIYEAKLNGGLLAYDEDLDVLLAELIDFSIVIEDALE